MSLFNELKRRNVFKVSAAYIIVGWLIMQIGEVMSPALHLPGWINSVLAFFIILGFPFALFFAWAFELTPEGLKKEKDVDRSQSITHRTGRKLDFIIIGLLVLALGYFTYDKFVLDLSRDAELVRATTEAATKSGKTAAADKSIAVLPFINMSSDPEQEYFADGISEEILNALSKVKALKVAGRTSSFAFKGKNDDLHAIGKVLRVSHILEGSVRKSGTRVRITAQLIKVEDGFHMWSESYERELDDIFAIQDEISAAILAQLKTQLLGDQNLLTARADARAYDLYLLAKQRIYERTQPSLEMAAKLLDEAISIDAGYAPAFAQLGITSILLAERNYGTVPHMQAGENAKRYLDKALQLAPQNAEAMAGMGLYFLDQQREAEPAIEWLQKALAINPNLVNANLWLGSSLSRTGKLRAALQLREQNHQRDPLHGPTFSNLAHAYAVTGQADKAFDMLENLQAYLPGDAGLAYAAGVVYLMSGQLAAGQVELKQAFEQEPLNRSTRLWYGLVLSSARQYELMAETAPSGLATLALSRLGRTEEALILGHQATSDGANPISYFQALVESGRFAQLLEVLESRWPSLDDFARDWPGRNGYGYYAMGFIAQSYQKVGNEAKFEDAMQRFKAALDAQLAEGADNWVLSFSRAHYAVLVGDFESAISLLEQGFQQGGFMDTVKQTAWPVFKPLNGDPRYEAAKAGMNARLTAERQKMGLEPLGSEA